MTIKKANLWYADWRDRNGRRRRKSFPTKREAKAHQDTERARAHEKKAPRRRA